VNKHQFAGEPISPLFESQSSSFEVFMGHGELFEGMAILDVGLLDLVNSGDVPTIGHRYEQDESLDERCGCFVSHSRSLASLRSTF
jgi:hypothetical protein